MAEIGTIAAAIQLADTVLKLRKLWADIRDAPKDLNELVEEVLVQADLLADVQNTNLPDGLVTSDSLGKCHGLFEKAVTSLQDLTNELSRLLKSKKRTGRVRLYFRKDELSRCKERLQRVQTIMILAQQSYAFAISTQQSTLILNKFNSITAVQASVLNFPSDDSTMTMVKIHPTDSSLSSSSSTGNAVEPISKTSQLSKARKSKQAYNFCLPTWILRLGLQVLINRSHNSMGITFRVYNRLPPGSELFQYARNDDWADVWRILESGRGSVFDVNEDGSSLLHIAASKANSEACCRLMDLGLDPLDATQDLTRTPLRTATWWNFYRMHENCIPKKPYEANTLANTEIVKILLRGKCDIFEDVISNWVLWAMMPAQTINALKNLHVQSFKSISATHRAVLATATFSFDPHAVYAWLGDDLSLEQAFHLTLNPRQAGHITILHKVIFVLKWNGPGKGPIYKGWIDILRRIISFQRSVQITELYPGVTLFSYISHSFDKRDASERPFNDILTEKGREWLQILADNGADLQLYGRSQLYLLRHKPTFLTCYVGREARHYTVKNIIVGPKVEDWKILAVDESVYLYKHSNGSQIWCWNYEGYEMAGGFWHLTENLDLSDVPGAYPDDMEQKYDEMWEDDGSSLSWPGPIM